MCFFCAEGTAIALAQSFATGKKVSPNLRKMAFFDIFYILESEKPLPLIKRVQTSFAQSETNFDNFETWKKSTLPIAVICRVCDILLKEGFSSPRYQALITTPTVSSLVKSFFSLALLVDQRLLTKESSLTQVLQENVFFAEEGQKFLQSKLFKKDCRLLLQSYLNWWYKHQNYKENEDINELETFTKVFPYVFLSFATIRRFYPTHRLIAQLVNTNPQVALGLNFDMWLQRVAATHLLETKGIEALLPYKKKCRPVILYYLLVSNRMAEESKMVLKKAVLQSGKYKADQPVLRFAQKRTLFYMDIEKFIMLELQKSNTG